MRESKHHHQHDHRPTEASLVFKVRELIDVAMGEPGKNVVDFKLLQNILYILASHLRILERKVDRDEETVDSVTTTTEDTQKPIHIYMAVAQRRAKRTKYGKEVEDTSSDGYVSSKETFESHGSDFSETTTTSKSVDDNTMKEIRAKGAGDKDEEVNEKVDATMTIGDQDRIQGEEKEQSGKSKVVDNESVKVRERKVGDDKNVHEYKDRIRRMEKSERKYKNIQGGQRRRSGGSIEVVTQGQFQALERKVAELGARAQPIPEPWLPGNEELMRGDVSLADVMQAMQLQSRVQAAEKAAACLAELISELFSSRTIPGLDEDQRKRWEEGKSAAAELASTGVMLRLIEEGLPRAHLDLPASSGAMFEEELGMTSTEVKLALRRIRPTIQISSTIIQNSSIKPSSKEDGWQAPVQADSTTSEDWRKGLSEVRLEKQWMKPTRGDFSSRSRSGHWKKTRWITAEEMQRSLRAMRKEFTAEVALLTGRTNHSTNIAAEAARRVEDKMSTALNLNEQLASLHTTVMLYTEQLKGYSDAGFQSQMDSFQLQLNAINEKLQEGLHLLQSVTNNANTFDVMEMRERCDVLTRDFEDTMHSHHKLTDKHAILQREFTGLADVVEQLRESKSDREEIEDGLKDKADLSKLEFLVEREVMEKVTSELEIRLQMCYDKFRSQNAVWMKVIQELNDVVAQKVNVTDVQAMRDQFQYELGQLNKKAFRAAKRLGDPKAAVISRRLLMEARCGACARPARAAPAAVTPPHLLGLRPRPLGAEDGVCYSEGPAMPRLSTYEGDTRRTHICQRWCGGSHTKLSRAVAREHSSPFDVGYMACMGSSQGTDHKMYYRVSEPCQPCVECDVVENIPGEIKEFCLCADSTDQGEGPTIVTGLEARRVTFVSLRAAEELDSTTVKSVLKKCLWLGAKVKGHRLHPAKRIYTHNARLPDCQIL